MNSKDPEFWTKLKQSFDWDAFGGVCLSCQRYIVNTKVCEFFQKNSLPLGTCMYCLEQAYKNKKRIINPIDIAFPSGIDVSRGF